MVMLAFVFLKRMQSTSDSAHPDTDTFVNLPVFEPCRRTRRNLNETLWSLNNKLNKSRERTIFFVTSVAGQRSTDSQKLTD